MKSETGENGIIKKLASGYGIAILIVLAVILLIYSSLAGKYGSTQTTESSTGQKENETFINTYTGMLETKIEALCRSINGISEVEVLVTLESGSEFVYAQNTDSRTNGEMQDSSRDYLIINQEGGENTVLVKEIYPKIRGIAIVCTNGGDITVQKTLTELLSAAFGVSSNRICIAG